MSSLLYAGNVKINDALSIPVPTVGYVIDNEDEYYDVVCTVIATPYDMMVQLDDAGIDFTAISEYDLFRMLFPRIQEMDTSMVFGGLDLSGFKTVRHPDYKEIVIMNPDTGIVIDRAVYAMIVSALRKILNLPKENKKPGNAEARKYLLERARIKLKRKMRKAKQGQSTSQLESYIVALVNTPEFKYDYESVRDISIYQFYESLKQIVHKIHYDNTMIGYYAGTVKLDDLPKESRSWIVTNE